MIKQWNDRELFISAEDEKIAAEQKAMIERLRGRDDTTGALIDLWGAR